ncbi:MAG: 30S ribosomal protein S1 [Clostridiales bacterium]|nr:30S ribosomal protein S1 [Clostridiales bacterium]
MNDFTESTNERTDEGLVHDQSVDTGDEVTEVGVQDSTEPQAEEAKDIPTVDVDSQPVQETKEEGTEDVLAIDEDALPVEEPAGEEAEDVAAVDEHAQTSIEPEEDKAEEITTMEGFEEAMVSIRPGEIIHGTVLSVNETGAVINIGYKSDGILPLNEINLLENQTPEDVFKSGDEIEVEVLQINDGEGNVVLSHKSVERRKVWTAIEQGFETGEEFQGTCVEAVKGGVIASIDGIRAFVPASHLSTRYVEDLSSFVGQPLRLKVIELEKGRRRVVASQRAIIEAEEKERRQKLWDSIEEGQKIKGTVKRLTNFGAFVDIGGVDGLIHISDISWGHIDHPREILKEEEQVEVIVLSADREKDRISLGYKQTLPHPWDNVEEKYPVDSVVSGKVVRITNFGAFVELEPGVDGLVHISQVANRRVNKVEDELDIGEEIEAKVLNADSKNRRISLSIRETLPLEEEKPVQPKEPKKQEQFKKEDMTVSLGEFFPEDFN